MANTISVNKRENPFVSVQKLIIFDGYLSPQSLGIIVYLLAKPEGWQIDKQNILARFSSMSLNELDICLEEIMQAGYLE